MIPVYYKKKVIINLRDKSLRFLYKIIKLGYNIIKFVFYHIVKSQD
jgi:hypothetical protein